MSILLDKHGHAVNSVCEWNAFYSMVAKIHGLNDRATCEKKEFAWFMSEATFTFCNLSANIYATNSGYNFSFVMNVFQTETLLCCLNNFDIEHGNTLECNETTSWQDIEKWAAQFNNKGGFK